MYLQLFTERFPIYVELMKSTEHSSPYHLEGSVWTHTCMVYSAINSIRPGLSVPLIAAILHDLGKCLVKEVDPETNKTSFQGHEGVSTHLALDILPIFGLPERQNIEILNLISLHGVNVSQLSIPYMTLFRHGDVTGRITSSDISCDYDPRKFTHISDNPKRTVTILTGISCSGKSTYTNQFKDTHTILSRENFIMSSKFNSDNLTYNEVYDKIHQNQENLSEFNAAFDKHIQEVSKDFSKDIIIDMTMLSLSSRRTMMNRFPHSEFKSVVFLTRLSTIDSRNVHRFGKQIPDTVLHMMQKSFVMPVREEGFSDIKYILG